MDKKTFDWIAACRLSVTIPAGLLVHVGFKLSHQKTDWWLVAEMILIAILSMLQNDYEDRRHDVRKGKYFAVRHEASLRNVLIVGWITAILFAITSLGQYAALLIPIILVCILYSRSREIMYLQTACVGFASASPLLLTSRSMDVLAHLTPNSLFFWAVFIAITGRETIKDVEDADTDRGWKCTPVSSGIQTKETAKMEAGILIVMAAFVSAFSMFPILERSSHPLLALAGYAGVSLCILSGGFLFILEGTEIQKRSFDVGMCLLLLGLSFL